MGKKVLMLNASHNDERLIKALKRLGCYVITTGNRPELDGHALADEYVFGDYTDLDKMLKVAVDKNVDAVCPCCNDFGVKTAAYISEKLGFSGQDSYETTLILHDKDRFKRFVEQHSRISTPKAYCFDDEKKAMQWAETVARYPLIVKPVDLSAGNGIKRARNSVELQENIHTAFVTSRKKRIVVEEFIEGTQHGFCTFLINQKVVAFCSNNEHSFINPYRVEVDTFPADNVELVQDELIDQIEYIAHQLQLTDGIFHLQYILKQGKAYILECMRRVLGNLYSIPAEKYCNGFDWDFWEAKAKCGFGVNDFPDNIVKNGFWAYKALIAKGNGVFESIKIAPEVKEYIFEERMLHRPGYLITNYLSDPLGFLFFKFTNAAEMHNVCIEKYSSVSVKITRARNSQK